LPKLDVTQTHSLQNLETSSYGGNVLENFQRFINSEFQHISNAESFVLNFQGFLLNRLPPQTSQVT